MSEQPLKVVITSVEARENGEGVAWVKIQNPYGKNDFHMEVPITKLSDTHDWSGEVRLKVYQFATALTRVVDHRIEFGK